MGSMYLLLVFLPFIADHASGSHGIAGIFVKYDMSALKVKVQQERDSLPKLLTRLCATIAGIHITMGK